MANADTKVPHPCKPCIKDNKYVESTVLCKVCKEFLCAGCYTFHQKMKILAGHETLTMTDVILVEEVSHLLNANLTTEDLLGAQVGGPDLNLFKSSVKLLYKVTRQELNLGDVFIYSGAFLYNGKLITTDVSSNTKRVLLFDRDYKYSTFFATESNNFGICTNNDRNEVHIVSKKTKLITYSTKGRLTEIYRCDIPQDSTGVCRLDDNIVTGQKDTITFHNIDGTVLSQQDKKGSNTSITSSKDGKTVYHRDGKAIVARATGAYDEIFRFENSSLNEPIGISCDRNDNILVVGYKSKNVFQISPDGRYGRVLLSTFDNIEMPCAVICHPEVNQFVVTSWDEDTVMEVYEFC